ncbi:hypothetical protein D3C80_1408820 [compost metagenome]
MLFPTNCARPRALSSAAMFPLAVLCAPASIVAIWVKTLFPLPPSPVISRNSCQSYRFASTIKSAAAMRCILIASLSDA